MIEKKHRTQPSPFPEYENYSALAKALAAPKPASTHTKLANQKLRDYLDFAEQSSFDNAKRGFIATLDPLLIKHDRRDRPVFDLSNAEFWQQEAPPTVNPSLWRQAQLNALHHGLYEVCDGIYQIRSFDLANMTLVRGDSGWIIIDPLTCTETSRAGLKLANENLGERPVVAVIHTHSHADHFAGVLGVVDQKDVEQGRVQVLAPLDYVDESLSENVLAGNAMNRRATYMYGNLLKTSETGFVTNGLGAALSMGTTGFVIPNDIISETGETRNIDGVEIEFQMTMGTEAPAEMVFYFPQFKALCMSEITSHHLHNVYTPRGAQVRDALAWSEQIDESIELFGDRLEIQFASHHWPIWDRAAAIEFLQKQRDTYKFIHDQTLRLANHGYNKEEIAEQLRLPDSLAKEFYNRDYYGTVNHNSRAVYVRYLGYFDGNPANLHPLPPKQVAVKYVDYMGGANAIVARAEECFANGEYRWVAEVLNHVVQVDVENISARALLADCYEQLGYQAESAPWRNFYLCGALELREGLAKGSLFLASPSMAQAMPLKNLIQTLSVRLNSERAESVSLLLNICFEDEAPLLLSIENAVLHAWQGRSSDQANLSVDISLLNFKRLMLNLVGWEELLQNEELRLSGDANVLETLLALFDQFQRRFPLVTARS